MMMRTLSPSRWRERGARGRTGFTLIELMVAIAAIGLLSLGLAQIFAVAGRTVSAGRRSSALTQHAQALERQLREDIAHMTRDGFLVIRHELANAGAPVRSGASAGKARPRRVDEVMFFTTGHFESSRPAYRPGRTATAQAARVYWGHGMQQGPSALDAVALNDTNAAADRLGRPGANQYASDWILARHVTLLAQPAVAPLDAYFGPASGGASAVDSAIQVGMQCAARDVFRVAYNEWGAMSATTNEPPVTPGQVVPRPNQTFTNSPEVASGVVDVAATDLASMRRTMMELPPPGRSYVSQPGQYSVGNNKLDDLHDWMRLALPADSDGGVRMRVEATPPNALGLGWSDPEDPASRADQLALASSAFMPACTDFVVEWSFGDTIPAGQPGEGRLRWHGLERLVDFDGDGGLDPARGEYYVYEYEGDVVRPPVFSRDGVDLTRPSAGPDLLDLNQLAIPQRLIHGNAWSTEQMYSYFGFTDPGTGYPGATDYNPLLGGLVVDVNRNNRNDPGDGDVLNWPDTLPWPWPKLLRVTVTLSDPNDPTVEQTFQFVLEVPQGTPGGTTN